MITSLCPSAVVISFSQQWGFAPIELCSGGFFFVFNVYTPRYNLKVGRSDHESKGQKR